MTLHDALDVLDGEDGDAALVERVRRGDNGAFEELYRRHSRIAVSVAGKFLGSPQDAEDAASEAFTNVLSALRRQVGPRQEFRPYLLACVRNSCLQRIRRSQQACKRERMLADDQPSEDERIVEHAVVAAAFRSMPARWQSALWMAEVQNLDPVTIAARLDVKVAAAGALVYRARQGFTEAYLAQHLSHAGRPACAALAPKLARYVRGTAGLMASRQVRSHLDECAACRSAIAELDDVNASLRSLTPPLALMTAAGTTAAAVSGGGATVAVSVFGLGGLAKIAAIAVLSTAPVLFGSDASGHATGLGRQAAKLSDAGKSESGHITLAGGSPAGLLGQAAGDSAPTETSAPGVPTSPSPTSGGAAGVDGPPASSPAVATAAGVGTSVDPNAGEVEITLTLPTLTLPALPAIQVSVITVPPITVPELTVPLVSVPPITVPTITVPPITVPPITVPPISVPPITVPPITVPPITSPTITLP